MSAAFLRKFCSASTDPNRGLNSASAPAAKAVPASAPISKIVPPVGVLNHYHPCLVASGLIPYDYFGKIDLYLHRTLTVCKIASLVGGLVGVGVLAYIGYPLWKVKAAEFQKMSDLQVYEKERELEAMEIDIATKETYLEYIAKKLNKQEKAAAASSFHPSSPAA